MDRKINWAFRMVHIDNVPHILEYGIVREDSPFRNPNYREIGDKSIIELRKDLTFNNQSLKGYIPFYFGPRGPMLYKLQCGSDKNLRCNPEDIIYLAIKIQELIQKKVECVFTDGHAINKITKYYHGKLLQDLNQYVLYEDIWAIQWADIYNPDLKRKKEAELLIKDDLHKDFIQCWVVYNENAKNKLINFGVNSNIIYINPNRKFYF